MPKRLALVLLAGVCATRLAAQAAPEPDAGDERPRGLLRVAELEAARTQKVLRERILGALRTYVVQRDSSADKGRGQIEAIVALGPDAAPILFEILDAVGRQQVEPVYAAPAARALVGIHERTKNVELLKSLGKAVKGGGAVRLGVVEGLEGLDHPMVVDIVGPLLQDSDATQLAAAVRTLGRQSSSAEFVGALLRPLLEQPGAPIAETLMALLALGDPGGVAAAQAAIGRQETPALHLAAVRYLAAMGRKPSLSALRTFLLEGSQGVADAIVEQAIDAVRDIGLREIESKKTAEDILLDTFKRHPVRAVADHARWQLGPYQNAEALKSLEDPVQADIRLMERSGRPTTDRHIELAEYRLRFEAWRDAIDALHKAEREDERGLVLDRIEKMRAVAWCGMGGSKLQSAEKVLLELDLEERLDLLEQYPILERMAKDPKYRELFAPR